MADNTKLQATSLPGGINPTTANGRRRPKILLELECRRRLVLKLKSRRS